MEYPKGIALTAMDGPRACGFVTGFADPERFYEFYRSKRLRLARALLPGLLRRPGLIPRVLANALRVSRIRSGDREAELSSIGVDPDRAGKGAGRALLEAFLREAARLGAQSVHLTTDADGNDSVNRFYLRFGFRLEGRFRQGRRDMNRYEISTAPPQAASIPPTAQ